MSRQMKVSTTKACSGTKTRFKLLRVAAKNQARGLVTY